MTLRHLKVFVAVCEHGGVTKAANALHMVQPAVSTTISELEKYYKVSLFYRINQRLVLTELGKELLIKARNILAEFDDFEETALLGGQNPRLRIGSSLTSDKNVLPQFLEQIKEKLPQLEPSFIIDKTSVIEEKLELGELDFAIIEGDIHSEHFIKTPLGNEQLIAVCSSDYDAPEQMTIGELVAHPLLLQEVGSASRDLLDSILTENHLSARLFVESISNGVLISFAESGHGIAILPSDIAKDPIDNGELQKIEITDATFSKTYYIIMHKNKRLNPLCKSAVELLVSISNIK